MPTAEELGDKLDSIQIFESLKKNTPTEEPRDFSSPRRIGSIDFVKGIAIILIIGAHAAGAWLVEYWQFFHGIGFAFLDIVGPSLFVFLSALSVVFSIRRKKGEIKEKIIRNRIFSRGIMIILIAVLFNVISIEFTIEGYTFPANLWGWNILMFIGFSQIFSYYALKLNKVTRAIIGLVIIFTSDPIRQFLFQGKEAGDPISIVLHFIITSPSPMTPLLPWLSICFISSIFGEYLYDAMVSGTKKDYWKLFRTFLFWGIVFILAGIFLGLNSYDKGDMYALGILPLNEYPHLMLLDGMRTQKFLPDIKYPGMWEFLIRGRAPNMIYNLGAALLLIAVCFYIIDIKRKMNNFISMIKYYGKASLSLFLLHFIFLTLFLNSLDFLAYAFLYFSYLGFWGFLMYIWNELYNGVGSPEWLMVKVGQFGQKKGKTVKKEILIIEEEIKETVKKVKKEPEEDSKN
ncbi:MAG: DUF1624 domain-containing protein [Candidatus Lokiarchaeota archaeon]|nr:DUF1624 domain-containing protein [Candidatus Lokiarchaeota archaeon]